MSNQANEEIKYLLDIINDVQYHKRRFKLMYGEDRYVFGVVSGKEALGPAPFSKLMEYWCYTKKVDTNMQNMI